MNTNQIEKQIKDDFKFLETATRTEGIETLTDLHTALGNLDHAIEALLGIEGKEINKGLAVLFQNRTAQKLKSNLSS